MTPPTTFRCGIASLDGMNHRFSVIKQVIYIHLPFIAPRKTGQLVGGLMSPPYKITYPHLNVHLNK